MSEHNFLGDIFTAIFLPLFLILILGLMAGVKTDAILTSYFRLILSIAGSCIEITAKLTGALYLKSHNPRILNIFQSSYADVSVYKNLLNGSSDSEAQHQHI